MLPIVVLLMSGVGCKKKEPRHYTISDELKQWYLYQRGSYWIYWNESTNILDSTYVEIDPAYSTYHSTVSDDVVDTYDHISNKYEGAFVQGFAIDPSEVSCHLNFLNNSSAEYAYLTNVIEGSYIDISGDRFEYVKHYDTLTFNGITFENVRYTKCSRKYIQKISNSIVLHFYCAKNIGLIKFRFEYNGQDTTWSLLRFHVIQ
jgi:hypothetical protein